MNNSNLTDLQRFQEEDRLASLKDKKILKQHQELKINKIKRVHWHWAASNYKVTDFIKSHYNIVIDKDGNEHAGAALPVEQGNYVPGKIGVSHTYMANTGAVGISIAAMAGAYTSGNTVRMGDYPLTWDAIDGMLNATVRLCKEFDITPSRTTTLSHAEVESNLGIKQRGKWDIRVLPNRPLELLNATEAGDILRKRMMDKYW